MKPLLKAVVATMFALTTSFSVRAAAVLSLDTPLTTEDQVLTLGTQVFGGNENFVSYTLDNGVDFQTQLRNATSEGTTLSGITVDTDGSGYGAHANVTAFGDNKLNAVMSGDALGSYAQIFVNGLTAGRTYVIQVFASMTQGADIGGGNNNPSSVYSATEPWVDHTNGGTTTLSWGQTYDPITQTYSGTGVYYFTDTFVAGGSSVFLESPQGQSTSGQAMVAALQIRDITDVPEPSTYAMIGLGLAALLAIGRRRGLAA